MLKKIKSEFKYISFPSRKETIKETAAIIGISAIGSVFLALIHTGMTELIQLIL